MQAYAGSVSFDPNNPQGSITQMVIDGTQGTSQGPGLVQVSTPLARLRLQEETKEEFYVLSRRSSGLMIRTM